MYQVREPRYSRAEEVRRYHAFFPKRFFGLGLELNVFGIVFHA